MWHGTRLCWTRELRTIASELRLLGARWFGCTEKNLEKYAACWREQGCVPPARPTCTHAFATVHLLQCTSFVRSISLCVCTSACPAQARLTETACACT